MTSEAWVGLASLLVTLAVIIYHSGKQSARVDSLEQWRAETIGDMKAIRSGVDYIRGIIDAEHTP